MARAFESCRMPPLLRFPRPSWRHRQEDWLLARGVCSSLLPPARRRRGEPLPKGKRVTGFSNSEEAAVELTDVVPFLVEDQLIALGGHYEKAEDWTPHVVVDGLLITGQNPASSEGVADALLKSLQD